MERKKIEYLVVDTGAFLKNASIQDLGENVVTCQEVVNEVTNSRQLRRLVVLPFELQIKEVFPENVQFVTEFSKKTGDYPSLSATDIKVIALTYQLEKEKVGTDHLKTAPEAQRTITFQNRPVVDPKDVAGFYIPSKGVGDENNESNSLSEKLASLDCKENSNEHGVTSPADSAVTKEAIEVCDDNEEEDDDEDNYSDENDKNEVGDAQHLEDIDPSSVLVKVENSPSKHTHGSEGVEDDSEEERNAESCDDDSDEGGWITPNNINQAKKQMNAQFEEEKDVKVACVTTDFAMQNVLKQIGLNVSSVDGLVIKQLRTFILRCYACFKTTSIMTKAFCPHCGHKTLKRVAVSVEPDGSQKIHINMKKPLTCKGKRFSMPTWQGGKHANNPIIFADQPMPDQRPSRMARTKTNILDVDYIPGYSPFAMRDTTSKSAMLGIRGTQDVKHWMRRNPNGKKKK
ncbi:RNA-binding protein NOB1 [Frankliniella fusca]|uniref:RNA-binding protein NOB1 n=1 Tax=Frankliniella fusca TaxID=407009 RepID=A0AAE1LLF7_9NEOP|nr:RNA-binding protein NOB1 [Frankliniella fusca]